MRLSPSLFLLAVVFASACVIPGLPDVVTPTGGVEINRFEFVPQSPTAGESTILFLELQNKGGVDARDVSVFLYGLSSDWNPPTAPTKIAFLGAPQPQVNLEGQKEQITWTLTAPPITQKSFNFVAGVRVCYQYKTVVKTTVDIISAEEQLARIRAGTFQKQAISVQETAAPVSVTIESDQPLTASQDTVNLQITITNRGGGTVTTLPCSTFETGLTPDSETLMSLNRITFKDPRVGSTICSWPTEGVTLEKGQSRMLSVTCTLGGLTTGPLEAREIELEVGYHYYVDRETSVIVESLPGMPAAPFGPGAPTPAPTPAPTETCATPLDKRCKGDELQICIEGTPNQWQKFQDCTKAGPGGTAWKCDPAQKKCVPLAGEPTPTPTGAKCSDVGGQCVDGAACPAGKSRLGPTIDYADCPIASKVCCSQ